MDYHFYQEKFQDALDKILKEPFDNAGLQLSIDTVLESVVLKIYKPEWSSDYQSPLKSKSRIFFSVWISDKAIKEGKLYYNIHALKLRELKGYKIASRDFAENFRDRFTKHQIDWENVSVQYGPLTLMEGWVDLKPDNIQNELLKLAQKFLEISPIIDETLDIFKSK